MSTDRHKFNARRHEEKERITKSFLRVVESFLTNTGKDRAWLAERLEMPEGTLRRVLDNPWLITLELMSEICTALNLQLFLYFAEVDEE